MDDQPAPTALAATAGLGRRLGSLCYEILLLAAVLFVGAWAFLFLGRNLDPALAHPLFQLFLFAIGAAYFIYCWTRGGQTLPMKTWRIRLVTRGGGAIPLRTAICRYLFAVAGAGFFGLGFIWGFFDGEGQFLHDRLAGTKIVRIED